MGAPMQFDKYYYRQQRNWFKIIMELMSIVRLMIKLIIWLSVVLFITTTMNFVYIVALNSSPRPSPVFVILQNNEEQLFDIRNSDGLGKMKAHDVEASVFVATSEVPFNKGAFKIKVVFPEPFPPPTLKLKAKSNRQTLANNGTVYLNKSSKNWMTEETHVFEHLVKVVVPGPLEFVKSHAKFVKDAETSGQVLDDNQE